MIRVCLMPPTPEASPTHQSVPTASQRNVRAPLVLGIRSSHLGHFLCRVDRFVQGWNGPPVPSPLFLIYAVRYLTKTRFGGANWRYEKLHVPVCTPNMSYCEI